VISPFTGFFKKITSENTEGLFTQNLCPGLGSSFGHATGINM